MIVVADASPLIFLAKVRRLELVHHLLGRDVRLPTLVRGDLLARGVDPAEASELEHFLESCTIHAVRHPRRFASAMSEADDATLTFAVRARAGSSFAMTRRLALRPGWRGSDLSAHSAPSFARCARSSSRDRRRGERSIS